MFCCWNGTTFPAEQPPVFANEPDKYPDKLAHTPWEENRVEEGHLVLTHRPPSQPFSPILPLEISLFLGTRPCDTPSD